MSSKAGLRAIKRLKAGGKLREIKKTVISDMTLLQRDPKGFTELQFKKLMDIAVSLHQEETLKRCCLEYTKEKDTE